MFSGFDPFALHDAAGALRFALAATAIGIALLLAFILLRRLIRRRYFRRRDQRVQWIRSNWERVVALEIPPETWRFRPIDRQIIEGIALDRMEVGDAGERRLLQEFLRTSGLFDSRVREVRVHRGWRRRRSILMLGRMRLPEGIPALREALQDSKEGIVVDAIRALGLVGTPKAGEAILERLAAGPAPCPPQALHISLVSCYEECPTLPLNRVTEAGDALRPVLARVLAEVVKSTTPVDVLALAADTLAEVRASAARILAIVRPPYAVSALAQLANDEEWFVRLRAMVAMGRLLDPSGIPVLIGGLCDSHRLVRLRAAAALARFEGEEERILRLTMRTRDQYALQALVSEMQLSGRITDLVNGLADPKRRPLVEAALLAAVKAGSAGILVDLALRHPNARARSHLTRLLARSEDPSLLRHLEQVDPASSSRRQKRVMNWLAARLQGLHRPESAAETVLVP